MHAFSEVAHYQPLPEVHQVFGKSPLRRTHDFVSICVNMLHTTFAHERLGCAVERVVYEVVKDEFSLLASGWTMTCMSYEPLTSSCGAGKSRLLVLDDSALLGIAAARDLDQLEDPGFTMLPRCSRGGSQSCHWVV